MLRFDGTTGWYWDTPGSGGAIATDSVGTAAIQDGAVTSAKIADGTITSSDLASDSVDSSKIVDGSITANDLASGSVTNDKLFGSISDTKLSTITTVEKLVIVQRLLLTLIQQTLSFHEMAVETFQLAL